MRMTQRLSTTEFFIGWAMAGMVIALALAGCKAKQVKKQKDPFVYQEFVEGKKKEIKENFVVFYKKAVPPRIKSKEITPYQGSLLYNVAGGSEYIIADIQVNKTGQVTNVKMVTRMRSAARNYYVKQIKELKLIPSVLAGTSYPAKVRLVLVTP